MPTTPSFPTSETTLCTVPTNGRVAEGIATTEANVGSRIPSAAIRRQSAAVDRESGS